MSSDAAPEVPEVPGSFGTDTDASPSAGHDKTMDEDEVTRRLQDVESSFMPDETFSHSPDTHKTINRVISMATIDGYETADEDPTEDISPTGTSNGGRNKNSMGHSVAERGFDSSPEQTKRTSPETPKPASRRQQYLSSRFASPRSSHSSRNSTGSDFTIGADYALQTGGGATLSSSTSSRPSQDLMRSISLASLASGITDPEAKNKEGSNRPNPLSSSLFQDEEEERMKTPKPKDIDRTLPQTPNRGSPGIGTPTDSIINQHVERLEVPGTIARHFEAAAGAGSPEGRLSGLGVTPINARIQNLALKEQGNIVDKLQKENFKLKMKLYYLEKRLAQLSDEEVKRMIAENIELSTYKISAGKEIRALNKQTRELQFQLNERDARLATQEKAAQAESELAAERDEARYDTEQELSWMRERIATYEVEIQSLQDKFNDSEAEKHQFAEMVKTMSNNRNRGSNIELREEIDLWKDLAEAEASRKEQTMEENRKLREEIWQLKNSNGGFESSPGSKRRSRPTTASDDRNGPSALSGNTLVELDQLRHENADLRREVGAQTSMLRSRNREREKLYQEIEDLKMGFRQNGGRSTTDDSIFERSASRAHAREASRTSSQNRSAEMGDAERESLEMANGQLRDALSMAKMENQELSKEMEKLVLELEKLADVQDEKGRLQRDYDELEEQSNQEIMALQDLKDEGWQKYEEQLQAFEDLREEAQERIDGLDDEVDQRQQQISELEAELEKRDEERDRLRNEVRMVSEGLEKIEADNQSKIRRIKELEMEIEDLNTELEAMEKTQSETGAKNEKLSVELESRQSECAFLREEQDNCMIKIGELESAHKIAQASLESETQRAKAVEKRLAEERSQREAIGNKEEQKATKMMTDMSKEVMAAKEETRKLQKAVDIRETEAKTWKDRLFDIEASLRELLGDEHSSKNSYIEAIMQQQRNVQHLTDELALTKQSVAMKDQALRRRDQLLENSGLESQKLADLLEKQRAEQRAERAAHEHWQASHQHSSNTISIRNSRITELEAGRQSDRRKLAALEQQLKEQLHDRNELLLTLWHRLGALCGTDWQHQNSLVGGYLPTVEVVSTKLPGFSKNLVLAIKTVEGMIGGFRAKIRAIEKDLQKDYAQLEHALDVRIKRLDRLEAQAQMDRISIAASAAPELAKARAENRLLKQEVQQLKQAEASPAPAGATAVAEAPASDQRWIHRLKELEKRLKSEREGRLLDRNGARKRLEEGRTEIEELKAELERTRQRLAVQD